MALRPTYQQTILPNVLYEVRRSGISTGSEQVAPSIEVIGGVVSIYGAQTLPAAPPTGMSLAQSAFSGVQAFGVIPNYLYVSGSPTSIVLSGVQAVVATT